MDTLTQSYNDYMEANNGYGALMMNKKSTKEELSTERREFTKQSQLLRLAHQKFEDECRSLQVYLRAGDPSMFPLQQLDSQVVLAIAKSYGIAIGVDIKNIDDLFREYAKYHYTNNIDSDNMKYHESYYLGLAIKDGIHEVIDKLLPTMDPTNYMLKTRVNDAAEGGHIDLIQKFELMGIPDWKSALIISARNGHLNAFKYIETKLRFPIIDETCDIAINGATHNSHTEVAQYIYSKYPVQGCRKRLILNAIEANNFELVHFYELADNIQIINENSYWENGLISAVQSGNVKMVQYVETKLTVKEVKRVVRSIIMKKLIKDQPTILQYFISKYPKCCEWDNEVEPKSGIAQFVGQVRRVGSNIKNNFKL